MNASQKTTAAAGAAAPEKVASVGWAALDPSLGRTLVDARMQLHHAAQLASGAGASYLHPQSDDSHTNLEWSPSLGALLSNPVAKGDGFRIGVAVPVLTLLVTDTDRNVLATHPLDDRTLRDGEEWIREQIASRGADPAAYARPHHFSIPEHAVARGEPFRVRGGAAFEEMSRWFADGASLLEELRAATPGASPVRCWPHHFDIATSVGLPPHGPGNARRSMGIGMSPGDEFYQEPYFYVTPYPQPKEETLIMPLGGAGRWHSKSWIGAVLTGSHLAVNVDDQRQQVRVFLKSAIEACRLLLDEPATRE